MIDFDPERKLDEQADKDEQYEELYTEQLKNFFEIDNNPFKYTTKEIDVEVFNEKNPDLSGYPMVVQGIFESTDCSGSFDVADFLLMPGLDDYDSKHEEVDLYSNICHFKYYMSLINVGIKKIVNPDTRAYWVKRFSELNNYFNEAEQLYNNR